MQAHPADKALARAVLKGDREALRTLFDTHHGPIYRYCLQHAPEADAEEIASDTLRQAIRRIETYRGEAALATWIHQIARSQLSQHFRRAERRPQLVSVSASAEQDEQLPSEVDMTTAQLDTPEEAKETADRQALVHRLLDLLPGDYGNVLEWKYIEGLSVEEIAGRLSTTTLAVQSKLARARRAFKERVAGTELAGPAADGGSP